MSWGAEIQYWLGPATFGVAAVGLTIVVRQALFMMRSDAATAKKLRDVFITDSLIFIGAITTAIWFFLEFRGPDRWVFVNLLDFVALSLNLLASWNLYRHWRKMTNGEYSNRDD